MDYKRRLVLEYRELVGRREVLERTISSDENKEFDEKIFTLLKEQLDAMLRYEEILYERIVLMMK